MQTTPIRVATDPLPEVTALRLVSGCSPDKQPLGKPPVVEAGHTLSLIHI